ALWPNPYSGRRLRSLLREAGLDVEPDVGSSALVVPEEMLPGLLATQGAALVEAGVVTADEVSALNREVEAASGHGDAFVSVTMFAAIGRRPE
ncbi:methyltransferase domain-containing protein, partial [Phycicoccus flavus]